MTRFVTLGVAAVVGCGGGGKVKTKQDLDTEYGAKLKPRMEVLLAARMVAEQTRHALGVAGGPEDVDVDYNDDAHTGNTVIVQSDDLANLAEDAKPAIRFADLEHDDVRTAKSWTGAKVGLQSGDWAAFEDELQHVIGAKYALVVFAELLTAPSVGLGGTSFTPGKATATVVLVEIDRAQSHGGFTITATSSNEILTKQVSGAGAIGEKQRKVEADLAAQLGKEIAQGIPRRWKNAKAPYNWGFGY